jgi:hypothetical protein
MRYIKVILLIGCVACAAVAAAQGTCSTEMLQGTYAVEHTGLVFMTPVSAPYSLMGTITADAAGNLQSSWVQVSAYGSSLYPQSAYWTVTPDCVVTMTVPSPTGAATSEGLVIKNGAEIRMMLLAPRYRLVPPVGGTPFPSVGSGTLHRLTPGADAVQSCSNKTLRGTYAQTCSGFAVNGSTTEGFQYVPFRSNAVVTLFGDGTGQGSGKMVSNGQLIAREYSNFTYDVAPSCWATATFQTATNETWKESLIVFGEGKEMISTLTSGPTPPGASRQVNLCRYTRMDH